MKEITGIAMHKTDLVLYQKYTYEDVCRLLELGTE